jgi:glycosyltransferase involved in cell wall biosynthesis
MSLLEAMAVGTLCVTTPVGSIPEVITDRENGLLVSKEDPAQLQEVLEEIILNPAAGKAMAAAGQLSVQNRFNGEVFRKALEMIYQSA